ncbi:sigma-54-dependent Fis family transcriptional regulator [Fusibacter sp. JL216-2]|uniref:sigma-54-dependent Fis family transcriptional regulator n=1 Tax=Fusibacter sp. JL216-2 TaxID=3071453 RepID=UPI003D34B039
MPGKRLLEENELFKTAWIEFVRYGRMDRESLRPIIADSWIRSRRYQVNPDSSDVTCEITGIEFQERYDRIGSVLDIAKPFMETLYKTVGEAGMVVRLTDRDGYVLECFGDELVFESHQALHLYKGTNVKEEVIGTNAIGIALAKGIPLQVLGAEHFRIDYHDWTTSAAPITNDSGEVIAVLSMSGDYELVHPHTLGMVMASALAIEHEFKLEKSNQDLKRKNDHFNAIMESISEGIICIDERGVIRDINLFARNYLRVRGSEAIGADIRDLIRGDQAKKLVKLVKNGKALKEEEFNFSHSGGRKKSVIVNATPVSEPNDPYKELVITFRESKDIHNLVNKIVGAKAIYTFDDILGDSSEIKEAIRIAKLVSDTEATILLTGESGTGKELFAQSIHNDSHRRNNSFVFINCGAIPRDLVASELFGYVEGAFTGARKGGQPGKFELADGGTLFLDEIGDMPLDTQANLLRVLETKEVVRVGGHDVIPVDVRVIAATHKDLTQEVRRGNFRQDLFFRLNVMPIHTPALRERRSDIPSLIDFFYNQFKMGEGKAGVDIAESFYTAMTMYDWPGNVRELQNVMQLASNIVGEGGVLTAKALPDYIKTNVRIENDESESVKSVKTLAELEREAIQLAIAYSKGNLVKAAKSLGIGRTTLYRKIEKYGLTV